MNFAELPLSLNWIESLLDFEPNNNIADFCKTALQLKLN